MTADCPLKFLLSFPQYRHKVAMPYKSMRKMTSRLNEIQKHDGTAIKVPKWQTCSNEQSKRKKYRMGNN